MACTLQFVTIVIIFGVFLFTLTFYKYISHNIFFIEEVNGINITVIMGSSQFILGLLIWLHYKRNQDHKNDSEKKKLLDILTHGRLGLYNRTGMFEFD